MALGKGRVGEMRPAIDWRGLIRTPTTPTPGLFGPTIANGATANGAGFDDRKYRYARMSQKLAVIPHFTNPPNQRISMSQFSGARQMRKVGYARVSSLAQNLDRQIAALRSEQCDEIFREKISGKDIRNRPQLENAIDALGIGDVLVVPEWDRATRSMIDGVAIIDRLHKRGALIKVLDKPHLDLTSAIGRGFIAFLSALAEDERTRILARCTAGRKAARERGVAFGRRHKLTTRQRTEALQRLLAGESARAIAPSFNVDHSTISRLAR
jgi:DNA invertase Pin-like site-specific DNA recombinase